MSWKNTQPNLFSEFLVVDHKPLSEFNDVVLHALTIPFESINAVETQ
jgi:hypothetical protein